MRYEFGDDNISVGSGEEAVAFTWVGKARTPTAALRRAEEVASERSINLDNCGYTIQKGENGKYIIRFVRESSEVA